MSLLLSLFITTQNTVSQLKLAKAHLTNMADRHNSNPAQRQRPSRHNTSTIPNPTVTFLRKLQERTLNSTQLVGFLTLIISASVILLLTGLTVTVATLGLIFFTPLIIISSPVWIPIATVAFFVIAGILSMCSFAVAVVGGLSWTYRYINGLHPPGSDRVDYARSRIYDTASHVKDYAREYGGYLHNKVKDAAPGA